MQLFWGHVFELSWFSLSHQPFKLFFESKIRILAGTLKCSGHFTDIIDNLLHKHSHVCVPCVCVSWQFKIIPWPTQSHLPSLTTCQAAAYLRKILIFGLTHDWGSAPKLTNWQTNTHTHSHSSMQNVHTSGAMGRACLYLLWPLNLQAALQAKLPGCIAENHIKIQRYKLMLAQVKMFDA